MGTVIYWTIGFALLMTAAVLIVKIMGEAYEEGAWEWVIIQTLLLAVCIYFFYHMI